MLTLALKGRRRVIAHCYAPLAPIPGRTYLLIGRRHLQIKRMFLTHLSSSVFCLLEVNSWLYTLFLGIDANFRLKRLNVSNHVRDPGLNQGSAFVVNETKFKSFLQVYDERIPDDTSTCNNHDAIKSASSRGGKGIAASGVGTVDCSRHDMKRPLSVGDLQKGEWYVLLLSLAYCF